MFRVPWFWLWSSLVGFSFVIEYLQGALRPLRTFSLEDAYANVLGIMIAMVIMVLWRYIAPEMLPDSAKPVGPNK
jgi:VanZ family protein